MLRLNLFETLEPISKYNLRALTELSETAS
jgi:hypothetical protein